MDDHETLKARVQMLHRREDEMREQLAIAHSQSVKLIERLTLTDHEKAVLKGDGDGCIRSGAALPIFRRVFGELTFT